jgi:transcriptional repressor NrdR
VRIGVVKRSGKVERFDREKILRGLRKACANRPVDGAVIEEIARSVEDQVWSRAERGEETVPSQVIGELVLNKLAEVDRIAYLRFASVYRRFDDPRDFEKEIARLLEVEELVSDSSKSPGF